MAIDTLKVKARDELLRLYNDQHGPSSFNQLNSKQQSLAATRFYIEQILNATGGSLTEDDIDEGMVDGSNDLGCDFISRDDGHVFVIQTKYRRATAEEDPNGITDFKSILKRFRNPSLKPNVALAAVLGDIDWVNDSFELVYMSFSRMGDGSRSRLLADQTPDYPSDIEDLDQRCHWKFLDETDLNEALRGARNLQRGVSDKAIKLYPQGAKGSRGAASVIQTTSSGGYRSFVMTLTAQQMVRAYQELGKDALFSLNIRNYIGNTRTNKNIINTAETEPGQFFLFNNGVSGLATRVALEEDHLSVSGLQIINGAQTVKALVHVANQIRRSNLNCWNETEPQLLVRITEISEGYGQTGRVRERITQYNNTQNAIKISDFRSNDPVQYYLKEQFESLGSRKGKKVVYLPKRTDRVPSNSEVIRMEEFAKSAYAFLWDFVEFSGSSTFLFNDDTSGGYRKVFGDGQKIWEQMPDDEFKLRAAIYWLSQETSRQRKLTIASETDADSKAALERKWVIVNAMRVVAETMFPDDWKFQLRKLHRGDWEMGVGKKGEAVMTLYRAAVSGVTTAYKVAKRNNKSFVHRNWMRSKETPLEIRDFLVTAVLPHVPKLPEIPS